MKRQTVLSGATQPVSVADTSNPFLFMLFLLFLLCPPMFTWAETMEYRYWNGTGGRNNYELSLLQLALEKTASTHPAFAIVENNDSFVSIRARREIQSGSTINIYTAPVYLDPNTNSEGIISVPIPILKGLLGYRRIIIRKEDKALFDSVTSETELKKLRAGQGRDWQDNLVYRTNAYTLVDNGEFDQLAPMLSQKRFDYLPLGIAEVDAIFASIGGAEKNMAIDPAILIYYPLPVFFHVSGKYPELAERVEKGLWMAINDGSFDSLFHRSFKPFIDKLNSRDYKLFVLKNPYLSSELGLDQPRLIR